ncbi:MAG: hypothetical protein KBC84_09090 [Proteobacteria bacterium]|nr:hypothetical protein [Pseudomonadota bacterium]
MKLVCDNQIVKKFVSDTKEFSKLSPFYEFDFSWQSIGLLDLVCATLIEKDKLTLKESSIVKGVAAYLIAIVQECWKTMELETKVFDSNLGLSLHVVCPATKVEQVINVERDVRGFLRKLPNIVSITESFSKKIEKNKSFFPYYALGLLTGQSPRLTEGWGEVKPKNFEKFAKLAEIFLAKTAAENYARNFPNEPLGKLPEVYLDGLIFPILSQEDSFFGERAVISLVNFAKEYNLSVSQLAKLGQNLACCQDPTISAAGLVLYAACSSGDVSQKVIYRFEDNAEFAPKLREAVTVVRSNLGITDWYSAKVYDSGSIGQIYAEIQLGFFQNLKLSKGQLELSLKDPIFVGLLKNLALRDSEAVYKAINQLVQNNPETHEYKILKSALQVRFGEVALAESTLGGVRQEIVTHLRNEQQENIKRESELEAKRREEQSQQDGDSLPHQPRLIKATEETVSAIPSYVLASLENLSGEIALEKQDVFSALKYFEQARSVKCSDLKIKTEISSNYITALLKENNYNHALTAIDISIRLNHQSVNDLFSKFEILVKKNHQKSIESLRAEIVGRCPFNSRVGSIIFFN